VHTCGAYTVQYGANIFNYYELVTFSKWHH